MTPHDLPQNWQITTIGESCIIKDNLRIPISAEERKKRNAVASKLYPYYGATGKAGEIDDYIFDEENVLLGEDGAPFLERKKDKAYLVCGKYWVNNHAHILQGKPNILDNKFLCHQLNIIDYSTYISGTTRLKLNQTQMKKIQIKLPPLEIQKKIVEILESKLEKIASAKALLESSLKECETYRLSLLNDAFSGNLTPHSQNWQNSTLGEIFDIERGGSPRPIQDYLTDDTNGINWIKIGDVRKGEKYITSTKQKIKIEGLKKSRKINIGDLLLTNSMSYGIPFISNIEGAIHDGWIVLKPKITISKEYVFYFLSSQKAYQYFDNKASGSTVRNLQINYVKDTPIPLPPLEIQREIVEILESKLEKIASAKSLLESSLKECETYRLSLLESAFKGELV